jgi:hypothetical protein
MEITRYRILAILKEHLSCIRKNCLYPTLTELVGFSVRLENLINATFKPEDTDDNFYNKKEIAIFGNLDPGEEIIDESSELIRWTISKINPILDEGIAVYEFISENMELELIQGDPHYKEEGYFIVPDNKSMVFNIYSFTSVLFNTENSPVKSIKTVFVQSLTISTTESIIAQYNILLQNIGDKNLPVYFCSTDLDFPFEETIFQIARKKLLKFLSR